MERQGRSVGMVLRNVLRAVAWCLLVTAALKVLNVDGRYTVAGGDDLYSSQYGSFWLWFRLYWPVYCGAAILDYVMSGKYRVSALLGITLAPNFHFLWWMIALVKPPADPDYSLPLSVVVGILGLLLWTFSLYVSSVCLIWPVQRMRMALRSAIKLRGNDDGRLVFTVNVILLFVLGEDEGTRYIYDIREPFECECRFNPVVARRNYFWRTVADTPMLVGLQIDRLLLARRWSRGLVFGR